MILMFRLLFRHGPAMSSYVQLQQRRFHRQQPGLVSVSDQAGTKKVEKTEFSDLRFN